MQAKVSAVEGVKVPPRKSSRHTFTLGVNDASGKLFLTDRVPFSFRTLSDTIIHTAKQGESLFTLAAQFYAPMPRPAGLWWIIADFQPLPIHDPTLLLDIGRTLFIPSIRTVVEDILSERRRTDVQQ